MKVFLFTAVALGAFGFIFAQSNVVEVSVKIPSLNITDTYKGPVDYFEDFADFVADQIDHNDSKSYNVINEDDDLIDSKSGKSIYDMY